MMADPSGGGGPSLLSRLPSLNQVLYGFVCASSVQGLFKAAPLLLNDHAAEVSMGDVVVKVVLLGVSTTFLAKSFATVDYDSLDGLEAKSYGYEAGEAVLEGTVPALSKDGRYEVATFAGGCFWGTELHYQRIPGVIATCVGYTQGSTERPNYEQVCGGATGHTEATQLIYDPDVCSYESLCEKLLGTIPDLTALNRVGNDRGTQYRHGIYTHTEKQAAAAATVVARMQASYGESRLIATEVKPASLFWPAEGYHQQYLVKGGQSGEKNAPEDVRCYG